MSKSAGRSRSGPEQEIWAERAVVLNLGQDDALGPDLGRAGATELDLGQAGSEPRGGGRHGGAAEPASVDR
jgi:hypothetical protein